MKASLNIKNDMLINGLYIFGMLLYSLSMFIPPLRVGVVLSSYLVIGIIIAIKGRTIRVNGIIDVLVICYLFYNVLAIIISIFNGFPYSVPIREFANSTLPIVLFFIGNNTKDSSKFYYNVLIASIFCIIIGIVLYIWVPLFYREYLLRIRVVGGTDPIYARERMCSIIGSTSVGTFSVYGLILSLKQLIDNKDKKKLVSCGICLVGIIMSYQRSAYLVAFCILLLAHYLCFFKWNILKKGWLLFEAVLFFSMMLLVYKMYPSLFYSVFNRILSFKDAFGDRTGQWLNTIENTRNIAFGSGLGSVGHTALGYSEFLITDGGLIKIFCEIGIIGFALFSLIILLSIIKCLFSFKEHYIELAIILTVLLQSLGSNTIAFMMEAIVFWYAVGAINYKQYKGVKYNENYLYVSSPVS